MECNIPFEALDDIFIERLKKLRLQINEMCPVRDVILFGEWLEIFQAVPNEEKVARNYLISLMSHQLADQGYLSGPFTDRRNLNRNLKELLDELKNELGFASTSNSEDTLITFCSHHYVGPIKSRLSLEIIGDSDSQKECVHDKMRIENAFLRRELETMRQHLIEKEAENSKLKGELETARLEVIKRKTGLKRTLLAALKNMTLALENELLPEHMFENILKECTHAEGEVLSVVRQLDNDFSDVLNKLIEKRLQEGDLMIATQLTDDYKKSTHTTIVKNSNNLNVHIWAQHFQNKMIKMKIFSMLRKVFMNGNTNDLMLMKLLEEEFHRAFNDLF